MTEIDLREASAAIDVFGYPLVSPARIFSFLIYIQSTPFIVPRWRGDKTLTLTEHMCVQLAVHRQCGPVSVVCSRRHVRVPARESVMHTDSVLPTRGRHTLTSLLTMAMV